MTHYKTLGVTRASTRDEVRSAYIIKAKAEHPDIVDKATDKFIKAHDAYRVLCHPSLRKQYNDWLDDTFALCSVCKGRGVLIKQRTLRERLMRPCTACFGSGVGDHK